LTDGKLVRNQLACIDIIDLFALRLRFGNRLATIGKRMGSWRRELLRGHALDLLAPARIDDNAPKGHLDPGTAVRIRG
jgi:hypothetical protein